MDVKTKEIVDFAKLGKVEDKVLKMPMLYSRDKAGKFRLWQIVAGLTAEEVEPDRDDTDGAWLESITWIPVKNSFIERGDLPDGAMGVYYTISGQEDGAVKITKPTYVKEGTNIGKKNYTTAFTGALRKVMTDYNHKIKKGSVTNKADVKMRNDKTTIKTLSLKAITNGVFFQWLFTLLKKKQIGNTFTFPLTSNQNTMAPVLLLSQFPRERT